MTKRKNSGGRKAPWTHFKPTPVTPNPLAKANLTPTQRKAVEESEALAIVHLQNSRYLVEVSFAVPPLEGVPTPLWLSFRYNDRRYNDPPWRDKQRIKNEICGSDTECVELYPHEGRLVDASDQYHLWVQPPGEVFPFGQSLSARTRMVLTQADARARGATQTDPEPNWPGYKGHAINTVGCLRKNRLWPHADPELVSLATGYKKLIEGD